MRFLDRIISFVFSIIMLIVSIIIIGISTKLIDPQMIFDNLNNTVFSNEVLNDNYFKIPGLLGGKDLLFNKVSLVGLILFLCSLKTTLFLSLYRTPNRAPVVVKTSNGEVQIATETIINTVKTICRDDDRIKDESVRIAKKKTGIIIYVMAVLRVNTNLKDITMFLQERIKKEISQNMGIRVIDVNIRIKNVTNETINKPHIEKPISISNAPISSTEFNYDDEETEDDVKEDIEELDEDDVKNDVLISEENTEDSKEDDAVEENEEKSNEEANN